MVHLADPLYYRELQDATKDHERVLYELIVDSDVIAEDATGWRRLKEPMVLVRLPPTSSCTCVLMLFLVIEILSIT